MNEEIEERDIQEVFKKISSNGELVNISGMNFMNKTPRKFSHLKAVILPYLVPDENGEISEIDIIDNLEKRYLSMYASLNKSNSNLEMKSMKTDDNKVIVNDGLCFHSTSGTLDRLESISNMGILASEWFGEFESERECCFCVTLDETHDGKCAKPNEKRSVLYFDMDNPIMQEILKYDYFKYVYLKRENPDSLQKNFSSESLELFEKVIEVTSKASKGMRKGPQSIDWYWKAIPGGIPPQLINGISIFSQNKELMQNIDKITQLFPNATIFNENREVLYFAQKDKNRIINDKKHTAEEIGAAASEHALPRDIINAMRVMVEEKEVIKDKDGIENE